MSPEVIIIIVLIGVFFKLLNIYSHYKNVTKGLNEQCKEKGITDEYRLKNINASIGEKVLSLQFEYSPIYQYQLGSFSYISGS